MNKLFLIYQHIYCVLIYSQCVHNFMLVSLSNIEFVSQHRSGSSERESQRGHAILI